MCVYVTGMDASSNQSSLHLSIVGSRPATSTGSRPASRPPTRPSTRERRIDATSEIDEMQPPTDLPSDDEIDAVSGGGPLGVPPPNSRANSRSDSRPNSRVDTPEDTLRPPQRWTVDAEGWIVDGQSRPDETDAPPPPRLPPAAGGSGHVPSGGLEVVGSSSRPLTPRATAASTRWSHEYMSARAVTPRMNDLAPNWLTGEETRREGGSPQGGSPQSHSPPTSRSPPPSRSPRRGISASTSLPSINTPLSRSKGSAAISPLSRRRPWQEADEGDRVQTPELPPYLTGRAQLFVRDPSALQAAEDGNNDAGGKFPPRLATDIGPPFDIFDAPKQHLALPAALTAIITNRERDSPLTATSPAHTAVGSPLRSAPAGATQWLQPGAIGHGLDAALGPPPAVTHSPHRRHEISGHYYAPARFSHENPLTSSASAATLVPPLSPPSQPLAPSERRWPLFDPAIAGRVAALAAAVESRHMSQSGWDDHFPPKAIGPLSPEKRAALLSRGSPPPPSRGNVRYAVKKPMPLGVMLGRLGAESRTMSRAEERQAQRASGATSPPLPPRAARNYSRVGEHVRPSPSTPPFGVCGRATAR